MKRRAMAHQPEIVRPSGPNIPTFEPRTDKARDSIIEQLRKKHGAESVHRMSQEIAGALPPVIPTGSLLLDKALGTGGWPFGRIVEIFGPEQGGKTTMALQCIAEAQSIGATASYIDAEHAFDPGLAQSIGVNVPDLLMSQPDTGEETLQMIDSMIRVGVNVIVEDSVTAMIPRAELDGEIGDLKVGAHARMMSNGIKRLVATVGKAKHPCIVIFINQIRMNIGGYGNPETTTGGKALKFYASVRLEVRSGEKLKNGDDIYGHRVRLKVVKNKLAAPHRQAETDLIFGRGLWKAAEILDLAAEHGIVQKSGVWYQYGEQRLGQGRDNAARFIEQNPSQVTTSENDGAETKVVVGAAPLLQEIERHVRAKLFAH